MRNDPSAGGVRDTSRSSFIIHHSSFIIAALLGAVTVLGYAPFYLFPLPVAALAALFVLWERAATPGRAATLGFSYGMGLFLAGVSWVYVSLHDFGSMPAPLAAVGTLLFCIILASLPALAAWLSMRFVGPGAIRVAVAAPALWTLGEWTRGWIFTGFPWLAVGYSQVPSSPLAGYAPVLGIYGVSIATAVSAGLIAALWLRYRAKDARGAMNAEYGRRETGQAFSIHHSSFIMGLVALWIGGAALQQIAWTEPEGEPVTVSLVQGNIAQDLKWREDRLRETLQTYFKLTRSAEGRLIILPETALPLFLDQAPSGYLEALAAHARTNGGDMLAGVPERKPSGEYFNSVVSLGTAPSQVYRKSHLVPFGEFIPLRPVLGWIVAVLAIPLQDFSRGGLDQRPLEVAGQRVAVNICYEDAFGEEIVRQLPEATLLANVSNVAWFGRSLAPRQHLQISQARAIETGRYMLRATNTGVTAVIDPRGKVENAAPEFETAVLTHAVRGYRGATPYVRWGNYAVLALCASLVAAAIVAGRRRTGR